MSTEAERAPAPLFVSDLESATEAIPAQVRARRAAKLEAEALEVERRVAAAELAQEMRAAIVERNAYAPRRRRDPLFWIVTAVVLALLAGAGVTAVLVFGLIP